MKKFLKAIAESFITARMAAALARSGKVEQAKAIYR